MKRIIQRPSRLHTSLFFAATALSLLLSTPDVFSEETGKPVSALCKTSYSKQSQKKRTQQQQPAPPAHLTELEQQLTRLLSRNTQSNIPPEKTKQALEKIISKQDRKKLEQLSTSEQYLIDRSRLYLSAMMIRDHQGPAARERLKSIQQNSRFASQASLLIAESWLAENKTDPAFSWYQKSLENFSHQSGFYDWLLASLSHARASHIYRDQRQARKFSGQLYSLYQAILHLSRQQISRLYELKDYLGGKTGIIKSWNTVRLEKLITAELTNLGIAANQYTSGIKALEEAVRCQYTISENLQYQQFRNQQLSAKLEKRITDIERYLKATREELQASKRTISQAIKENRQSEKVDIEKQNLRTLINREKRLEAKRIEAALFLQGIDAVEKKLAGRLVETEQKTESLLAREQHNTRRLLRSITNQKIEKITSATARTHALKAELEARHAFK